MIDGNERGIVKCDFLKGGGRRSLILSLFLSGSISLSYAGGQAQLSVGIPLLLIQKKFLWFPRMDWKQILEV